MKQEKWRFFKLKKIKTTKRSYVYKSYACTYDVEILNYFNPQIQLKDTESSMKNKHKKLLTKLKNFKFVAILVLEF